ncbi:MAG: DNA polymerase I [Muribaculaceae bacterium]|nr:DNA polymerase I [Muribaculaceae bacterium]
MEEKRLFLLDAYALIYRAYYALIRSPRITSKGVNTSAIFGFVNTLDEILRKENPSHMAVCFDPPGGHTFRHDMYPEYKAQRDKQPEDITVAVPYIKRILEARRIPVIEIEGYEADDVIGTLSRMAEPDGFTTYMMTPDKDYGQLVTDRVFMYRPALRGEGFEIRGPRQVCERYGIKSPAQVIDMLALEGDASDNIPGCPGVGEKTAVKLISEFGSVENLIRNAPLLKGAIKKKIEENADQILFSKELVTIRTDVPLPGITPESLIRREEDVNALAEVYRELEFRTFLRRLDLPEEKPRDVKEPLQGSLFEFGTDSDADEGTTPQAATTTTTSYTTADTIAEIATAIAEASKHPHIGISLTAPGTTVMTSRINAMAVSLPSGTTTYIPITASAPERQDIMAVIEPLFTKGSPVLVADDVKRDIILLRHEGIELTTDYYDVGVAHYMLDPEKKHTIDNIALTFLNEILPEPPATSGIRAKAVSPTAAAERSAAVASASVRLYDILSQAVSREGMEKLSADIEMPLIKVLADMEWAGVRIDISELAELSRRYTARLNEMEREAYRLAGSEFNIASPMQVGEILFGRLKIDTNAKRTKKGFYSTTEEILEKHRDSHPLVDLILRIRALRKLLTTYINALPELVNPATGKIHTSYNQTVTATGRISSTGPNLQNIPIRSDDGKEIRRAFIPDKGDILLSADYSQIELRLMADLSADAGMVDAFLSGADFHRATAAKIYHEPLEEVTDSQRRAAKTANFGIIYGISAFGLSERLGIPRSESKSLIENYFRTYPGVKEYMDRSIEQARTHGYVTTRMGRKRRLPDINSRNAVVRGYAERNAINAPLQGSAADIIKLAMVRINREMQQRGMRSTMILQVHDELIFNVVPDELPMLTDIVSSTMSSAYTGLVPLEVSIGTGLNWLEAH